MIWTKFYYTQIFKYSSKQHNIGNVTIEVDLKTTQLILTKTKKYDLLRLSKHGFSMD